MTMSDMETERALGFADGLSHAKNILVNMLNANRKHHIPQDTTWPDLGVAIEGIVNAANNWNYLCFSVQAGISLRSDRPRPEDAS